MPGAAEKGTAVAAGVGTGGTAASAALPEAGAVAGDETGGSKRSRPDAPELDSSGDEILPKHSSKRKC